MSVAFEYGGIDREPVRWAEEEEPISPESGNTEEQATSPHEAPISHSGLEIESMRITQ